MNDGFLYYALIFLASAVLVVPLAKRSGLGSILGYLLAGVVIGPFGMKFINNPDAILHFAEFGVVMMLFLFGIVVLSVIVTTKVNGVTGQRLNFHNIKI